jgi:hypothetical protein
MVFMRFGEHSDMIQEFPWTEIFLAAWRVQPRNYLLFACHFTNASAQTLQDLRFIRYWHYGGREAKLAVAPKIEEDKKAATPSDKDSVNTPA